MITINLPIDDTNPDASEARIIFRYCVERINQERALIPEITQDQLGYLAREFNAGRLKIPSLQICCNNVLQEAINRIKKH